MRIGRMRDGIGDVQRQAVGWQQPRAEDQHLGRAQLVRWSQEGRLREEDSAYEAGGSFRWRQEKRPRCQTEEGGRKSETW